MDELKLKISRATEEVATLEAAFQKAKAKEAKAETNYNKMKEQAREELTRQEDLTVRKYERAGGSMHLHTIILL